MRQSLYEVQPTAHLPMQPVNPATILKAISERMVTRVLDEGFVFGVDGPPVVKLCECFPQHEAAAASEYIARKASECALPDSEGYYRVVSVCSGMGSIHVGTVHGLKISREKKEKRDMLPSFVVSEITNSEMALIVEQACKTDVKCDESDGSEKSDESD